MNIQARHSMTQTNAIVGSPVDIAPWSYLWRRDRVVQNKPEAYFIPKRIKRQDEIYRTALDTLGDQVKSPFYQQEDLLIKQLPKPQGELLTGLLWVGGLTDYCVELVWPENALIPLPDQIEVRTYPTAWGWFGWSVDRQLAAPLISEDGHRWRYNCPIGYMMDYAYSQRVKAATEMIAVFAGTDSPIPELHVTGSSLGVWRELKFIVEWDLEDSLSDFLGKFETHVAIISDSVINHEDKLATISCLYSEDSRFGADSRFTCIIDDETGLGATVLLRELAKGPICVPEAGLFFTPAENPISAAEYIAQQKKLNEKNVRDMVNEHKEAVSWEELLRCARLWRCPDGTNVPPFPDAPAATVLFNVPDKRWEAMYEHAVEQLRGPHMWGSLAQEVARATLAMEMLGLEKEADKVYEYFLASPGIKADGDFTDAAGSLEWAKGMRHDMGYFHEGTHFSTGRLLFSMMHRYYFTGNTKWLNKRLHRFKEAADWIIRELRGYLKEAPNREDLHVFGLMPPSMLGDYAMPSSDWHWYYCDNAYTQMGLSSFADVLDKINDPDAEKYKIEASLYEHNLMNAVKRESLYAPVRRGRDGMSRSFIPRMAYAGGLLLYGNETNVPQFAMGINDLFQGALPLGEIGGLMDASDRRMVGTIDAMEETGMSVSIDELNKLDHPTADNKGKEKDAILILEQTGLNKTSEAPDDLWFWNSFSNLPKISHNANIYLLQDDIPNFLHFFFNHAIVMVGSNGKLWEHAHPDIFVECDNPDNGTAAWFTENFRNMLLTENNNVLWLAKATPRAWLEQGKRICVKNAPSFFGIMEYEIISDADNGKINAVVNIPDRRIPDEIRLRLRHPNSLPIRKVLINGSDWKKFNVEKEFVILKNLTGKIEITIFYNI